MAIMSTAALMLRGTRQPCKASTGPDRTSANNSARATGTNATCAQYRSRPMAPATSNFTAVTFRDVLTAADEFPVP